MHGDTHNRQSVCIFIAVLLGGTFETDAANIVIFVGVSSFSHQISLAPLAEELSNRGHNVTFVSPYHYQWKNRAITPYVPKALHDWVASWKGVGSLYNNRVKGTKTWYIMQRYGIELCDILLDDKSFVRWAKENRFDLLISDALCNECIYGLAHLHKMKIISFSTSAPYPWQLDSYGIPDESSWLPDQVYPQMAGPQSIFHRLAAMLHPLYLQSIRYFYTFPQLDAKIRAKLSPDFTSVYEMERNVSLLFINQHIADDYPRALPPNVVPIGGIHCNNNDLPPSKELESFLDDIGDRGFIYVSFGSLMVVSDLPTKIRSVFVKTLSKLGDSGIKVVWATNVRPEGLSETVFTSDWVPQQTILAHPKIRVFISHGGMLSIQEAIYHSVPTIAFPMFAEQDYNAVKLEYRKVGVKMEFTTVSEKKLMRAVQKILSDPSYERNMEELSYSFRNRPISPLKTAVWWTEHVLNTKSTESLLKPLSIHQSWWRRRQLDIWCILLAVLVLICGMAYCLIRFLLKWALTFLKSGVNKASISESHDKLKYS